MFQTHPVAPFRFEGDVRLACPVCSLSIWRPAAALSRVGVALCPRGHPIAIEPCAGLAEVLTLVHELDAFVRRAGRLPHA